MVRKSECTTFVKRLSDLRKVHISGNDIMYNRTTWDLVRPDAYRRSDQKNLTGFAYSRARFTNLIGLPRPSSFSKYLIRLLDIHCCDGEPGGLCETFGTSY